MKVTVSIDPNVAQTEVHIKAPHLSEEIEQLVQQLRAQTPALLIGFCDGAAVVLEQSKLLRVYSANKKVFAVCDDGTEYTLKMPLYEVQQRLAHVPFVRISNTELIALKKAVSFDLRLSGTICVKLRGGSVSYVSRRFVKHIKQMLGMGGK